MPHSASLAHEAHTANLCFKFWQGTPADAASSDKAVTSDLPELFKKIGIFPFYLNFSWVKKIVRNLTPPIFM